jgi:carboxylesterase type B
MNPSQGTPVLFVSINYRLSVYGFPIGSEAAQRGSLNLALYDQKTALEWIHSNIHNFGGDPEKVRPRFTSSPYSR